MRLGAALAAFVVAAHAGGVIACGYCAEDKIAAAYDHSVITHAFGRKHEVAFLAIEGSIAASAGLKRSIESAISAVPGIDRGTVRVSLESASLSFAYDPARIGPIMRAIEKGFASKRLSVSILRVIKDAPLKPLRAAISARS